MAEEKSEGGGSFLGNPNALLAFLTIIGGLWLVSQKLTSDRPVTPAGGPKEFVGDQKLEARLWEDPFKVIANSDRDKNKSVVIDLATLAAQIARQRRSVQAQSTSVLLLPVVVSGGSYGEDIESRVRCRFAVVSALGRSGYVPDDAEHIGVLKAPWPSRQELGKARDDEEQKIERLWVDDPKGKLLGGEASSSMHVRYEWYRCRDFSEGSDVNRVWPWVLVLWLDESCFEDEPLVRLALFLERLTDLERFPTGTPQPEVALIGPRRSSTLRAMLHDWQSGSHLLTHIANKDLRKLISPVLQRIDVYCATPSAMDEVLVQDPRTPDRTPRATVATRLTEANTGFKSFHNLAATDAQMAREVFEELKLRGADPGPVDPKVKKYENHLVLISEWDTFYGRMLSLTYGAELAVFQGDATSRQEFVGDYVSGKKNRHLPENFHTLVYLRGLDGQAVRVDAEAKSGDRDKDRSEKSTPASIEELRHWAPDVNKAEGQAQFDYLGRLGDQISELQNRLKSEESGRIKAIGIVGSDVYDTLLILQALRKRFSDVLFFTTDLDVRFLHPLERDWARNLIVASAYGLALHPDLQGPVAPFRDSTQTAQFAATLAALGNRSLASLVRVPPRRFEVGNRRAVDLSVDSLALCRSLPPTAYREGGRWLHPLTASERNQWQRHNHTHTLIWCSIATALLLAGAVGYWGPLRRLTWQAFAFPCKALDYSEEDVGGPDGAEALLVALAGKTQDERAQWLVTHPQLVAIRNDLSTQPKNKSVTTNWGREQNLEKLAATLVRVLNQLLHQKAISPTPLAMPELPFDRDRQAGWLVSKVRRWPQFRGLIGRYETRKSLDCLLDQATRPQPSQVITERDVGEGWLPDFWSKLLGYLPTFSRLFDVFLGDLSSCHSTIEDTRMSYAQSALHAAIFARKSARDIFLLRCRRLVCFWIGAIGLGGVALWIARAIWSDTVIQAEGEPFSLTSGTSAWPAEIIRLLVAALAVCFAIGLALKVRAAFFFLTRRYRLFPPPAKAAAAIDGSCACSIWYDYRKQSRFRRRWFKIVCFMALYFLFVWAIVTASGEAPLYPLRGAANTTWNANLGYAAFFGFLLLAFLTVGAAHRCRVFIERLSDGPTRYPKATRRYFSDQMGRIDDEYLDEWIDLQLIADLTEQVGRLVYYPAGLVLLMLVARNSWWDCWTWPVSFIVVYILNFILALASVVILQCAAKEAKRKAEGSLAAKVKKLQAQTAPSQAQNNASRAQELLKEISALHRGAFVPFWENPVVGAVFLSSGGTTILQVAILFMGR